MTTKTTLIDCEAVRGTFRQWRAQQEPLDAELSESLAALVAYQSHLDGWQQQLARERDELRQARERLTAERTAAEESQSQSLQEISRELDESREKIASLTSALLARTEELRVLDGRRAEVATELELSRTREKELKASVEELKKSRDQEELQWSEELRRMRGLLEQRMEETSVVQSETTGWWQSEGGRRVAESPVLGSIQEQFGKLRQQRASDRPALKKAR